MGLSEDHYSVGECSPVVTGSLLERNAVIDAEHIAQLGARSVFHHNVKIVDLLDDPFG